MKRTMKPRLPWVAGLLALIATLAVPLGTGPARAALNTAAPVHITYWFPWGGDSKTYEENRAKQFNATHRDIQATALYVPPDSGVTNGKLLSAIAAGDPPDLVVTNLSNAAAVMGYQNGLTDLTPYLQKIGWTPGQTLPAILPLMQYRTQSGTKIWAMPETGNLVYFYINKTLFRKAGLDPNKPPTTIAQLDADAAKLTTYNSKGGFKTIGFIPWAEDGGGTAEGAWIWQWVFGANFTKVVNGKVKLTLTDPAAIRALNWEATYAKKYGADKLATAVSGFGNQFSPNDPFISGQIAMMVGGNWHTEALRTYNPKLDYAVYPIPIPPGGRANATVLGMNIYMVPAGSKHPQEAVTFARWAGSSSAVIANENIWRTYSGYKTGANSPKNIWQQRDDPAYAVTEKLIASPNATNGPLLPISTELATDLWAAEQSVIYGKATAQKAMSQVQSRLQPLLDKDLHQ